MKYSVSIVSFTAFEHAKKCVAKVIEHSADFELIITSQGNPEAAAYFTEFASVHKNVRVVVNKQNAGFIRPHNYALTLASGDYFVALNDDLEPQPGWLAILEQPFWADPKCGLSAPEGGCRTLYEDFHGYLGNRLDFLEGACLMGRTSILRRLGLFSTYLEWAYSEDSDLSMRMVAAGYTLHEVTFPVPLVHHRAQTSAKMPGLVEIAAKNRETCVKIWGHQIRMRANPKTILIRRTGAWGDVLLTTPIIREIKRNFPKWLIHVETICTDIFTGNKDVASAAQSLDIEDAVVIDLRNCYERTPEIPIVDCYTAEASRVLGFPLAVNKAETFLWADPNDVAVEQSVFSAGKWVAVHTETSWKSKSWSAAKWTEVIDWLMASGWSVVLVGNYAGGDYARLPFTKDRRGKTSVSRLAAILSCCKTGVVVDSFVLHALGARGIPAVALFGCTRAAQIVTAKNVVAVESDPAHPVSGLRHRVKDATMLMEDGAVMDTIEPARVIAAIKEILK